MRIETKQRHVSIHFLQRQVFYVYQHWNSWCNKPPKPLRDHWQWYLQHPETQRRRSWPRKAPRLPGSFDPKIGSFDPYFSYFLHHLPTFWCRPPRILPRFWCQHLGHPTSCDLVTFCEVQMSNFKMEGYHSLKSFNPWKRMSRCCRVGC